MFPETGQASLRRRLTFQKRARVAWLALTALAPLSFFVSGPRVAIALVVGFAAMTLRSHFRVRRLRQITRGLD